MLDTDALLRHDYPRAATAMLEPLQVRPAVMALLALNDEIAQVGTRTQEEMVGLMRLTWWREALTELAENGKTRPHPVLQILTPYASSGAWNPLAFLPMLDAREKDLDEAPFTTLAEMEAYADATSGQLQKTWLSLSSALQSHMVSEELAQAARRIGTAWGLLGMVMATGAYAAEGKSRLPQEMFDGAAPTEETLLGAAQAVTEWAEALLISAGEIGSHSACRMMARLTKMRLQNLRKRRFRQVLELSPTERERARITWHILWGMLLR